jgi:hypothetical protein
MFNRMSRAAASFVMTDAWTQMHRALAVARSNVPAVYWVSDFARDGGLFSYGIDPADIFRRAYVACGARSRAISRYSFRQNSRPRRSVSRCTIDSGAR